ncbi:MAG: NCS2 family permease [Phycisphaerae bacterium]|jgi:AGZA family xanthine/uracil permease-like MFS transporter
MDTPNEDAKLNASPNGPASNAGFLEKRFAIRARGSTVGREVVGGLATFLTLSYILFVQPAVMGAAARDETPAFHASVLTAVCLASALACLLMGLLANFPVALAPAMGHNFFFAYIVCLGMGFTWQQALTANLIAGVMFLALSLLGRLSSRLDVRTLLFYAIPASLRNAIGVGIGLLIAVVGLKYAGVVLAAPGVGLALGIGKVPWTPVIVTAVGLAVFGVLWARKIMGAPLWAILASALTGAALGIVRMPEQVTAAPTLWATAFHLDFSGLFQLKAEAVLVVIATFLFLVVFDTVGTLAAVCQRAHLVSPDGKIDKGIVPAFIADAGGTVAGALLGTSTITSYVESLSGIQAGARTGLAAVVVAGLFVLAVFFSPLFAVVAAPYMLPGEAAPVYPCLAAVLIGIGALMMSVVRQIEWDDATEALPAFLCMIMMPLTLSITDGIAVGFISHVVLKVLSGRWREVHLFIAVCAVLLAARYVYLM